MLTTIQQVKDYLAGIGETVPTSHDPLLTFIDNAVSDAVERHCRRVLSQATYTQDTYVAAGGTRLWLRQWPIVSVSAIDETTDNGVTWTAVAIADYYLAPELELERKSYVVRPDGWPDGRDPIAGDVFTNRVTYVAGYKVPPDQNRNLPYDLEQAVVQLCIEEYLFRGKQALSNESFGGLSLTFDRWPLKVKDALRRYKRPRV